MQVSFGESSDHTIALITLDSSLPDIKEINIHPPTKRTIYADIADIDEVKIPHLENVKFKLSLSGDLDQFKSFKKTLKYRDLTKSGIKVVFKHKRSHQTPQVPLTEHKTFPDIMFSLIHDNPKMIALYQEMFGLSCEIVFEE
jgi:hypothetical protein